MSFYWGTLTISASTRSVAQSVGGDGTSCLLIGNESGLTVKVSFDGVALSKSLYPGTVDIFPVPGHGWNGNVSFDPVANLSNVSSWPGSFVQIDVFGLNESPRGTYPMALSRANNIGNTVSTNMGSATSLQNDNNADDTQVIEMQVTGSPSSTVRMGNNGNFFIKQYISGVLTTLFQVIENAATCLKLGATGKTTEVVGSLTVDQNATITGTSTQTGNVSMGGTLSVTGASTLTGNASLGGTLSVTGSSSLDNATISTDGSGNVTLNNNRAINLKLSGGGTTVGLQALSTNDVIVQCASGKTIHLNDGSGPEALQVNNTTITCTADVILSAGKLGVSASGDVLDASSSTNTYLKARSAGNILFQSPNGSTNFTFDQNGKVTLNQVALSGAGAQIGYLAGSLSRQSSFTGTGSGTYSHNLGATPSVVIPICTATNSAANQGYDSANASQVHVTMGASVAFNAWCFHT